MSWASLLLLSLSVLLLSRSDCSVNLHHTTVLSRPLAGWHESGPVQIIPNFWSRAINNCTALPDESSLKEVQKEGMRSLILTFLRRCICIRMQCLKCVFQACSLPLCAFMRVSHWLQLYVLSECNVLNIDARQCLTSLRGGWCKGCGSNSRLLGSCSILLTFLPPGPYYPSFLPGLCRLIAPLNAPYISPPFFLI